LAKVSSEVCAEAGGRNGPGALDRIRSMHEAGRLGEPELMDFARCGQVDETMAALALLCTMPADVIEGLVHGERIDPILILCRAVGFGWPTARAIIMMRPGVQGTSTQGLDAAHDEFNKLSQSTAQRALRFWRVRQATQGGADQTLPH